MTHERMKGKTYRQYISPEVPWFRESKHTLELYPPPPRDHCEGGFQRWDGMHREKKTWDKVGDV